MQRIKIKKINIKKQCDWLFHARLAPFPFLFSYSLIKIFQLKGDWNYKGKFPKTTFIFFRAKGEDNQLISFSFNFRQNS